MDKTDINLALSVFGAAALLGGPVAAAIVAAFTIGLLIGRHRAPR